VPTVGEHAGVIDVVYIAGKGKGKHNRMTLHLEKVAHCAGLVLGAFECILTRAAAHSKLRVKL
jgi:hypothetical protein